MGTSRSRSAGAFSDCVTRFRGGALRHAKFPKTSYKVQLLDTLKHGRCVGQNSGRGRGLIFLSSKVLVPSWAKRKRFGGFKKNSPSVVRVRHLPHRGRQSAGEGTVGRRRISWKRFTINSLYYIINLIDCVTYRICRKSIFF